MNSQFELDIRQTCDLELTKLDKELCDRNNAAAGEAINKRLAHKEACLNVARVKEEGGQTLKQTEQACHEGAELANAVYQQEIGACEAMIAARRQSAISNAGTLRSRREALGVQGQETATQIQLLQNKVARLQQWRKEPQGKELHCALVAIEDEYTTSLVALQRAQSGNEAAKAGIEGEEETLRALEVEIGVYDNRKRLAQEALFAQRHRFMAQIEEVRASFQSRLDQVTRQTLELQQSFASLSGGHEFELRSMVATANHRLAQSLDARLRSERMSQASVPEVRSLAAADPGAVVSTALKEFANTANDLLTRKLGEFRAILTSEPQT